MTHLPTKETYAIKVISKNQISNLRMKDQLLNEISILQRVHHKNIVKMNTYFEDDSNIYLVMELGGVSQKCLIFFDPFFSLICTQN